jgi:hypothetical protein
MDFRRLLVKITCYRREYIGWKEKNESVAFGL